MCGIIGYLGLKSAVPILVDGLKRLEYRGYDSAGMAVLSNSELQCIRCVGKVQALADAANEAVATSRLGIAHTRWATHGEPSEANAHPHVDCTGTIALVHNGIVENHAKLRERLEMSGHCFASSTDTETIVHLIEELFRSTHCFETAVRMALAQLEGTYGIAVLSSCEPDKIVVARQGSPLVIGVGEGEYFVASDPSAIVSHTRRVIYLSDGEMAIIRGNGVVTKNLEDREIEKDPQEIEFDIGEIEKGGFPHFMLKEIFDQPHTLIDALRGRLLDEQGRANLGGLRDVMDRILNARRIILAGCGTSWHSALVGEYMLEKYARIPVEVEYASEFRYRDAVNDEHDVLFAISQSGETADTLAALREARRKGVLGLGICNVVGSTIARESEGGIFIHAGPEIGVASTKSFTSQLAVLALITLAIGRARGMSHSEGRMIINELRALSGKVSRILDMREGIEKIAWEFQSSRHFLYLGRGYNFPVALEGALKMKEISYIHAEGYPAAEMKHGPIALVDEDMPVVFIAPLDDTHDKILSNIEEVKARRGRVIVIASEDDKSVERLADFVIPIPKTLDMLNPILATIPLQLLAYYIAVLRGCNVDQPRNLAKSVTVE